MAHQGIQPHNEYASGQDARMNDRVTIGRRRGYVIDREDGTGELGVSFDNHEHIEYFNASQLTLVERGA